MRVRLLDLAHARCGDKGDTANVGRDRPPAADCTMLLREVTVARVARTSRGWCRAGRTLELPNLGALNFLLHGALDGGGTVSLKTDAQGKAIHGPAAAEIAVPDGTI